MENKIILLDLNYTLAYREDGAPTFYNDVAKESYRQDLIDLLNGLTVAIITVRPKKYKDATLVHIKNKTGFTPELALFNEWPDMFHAAPVKKRLLYKYVFPKYSKDPASYLAIESNAKTRAMYDSFGIFALPRTDPRLHETVTKFKAGESIGEYEKLLF